MKKLPILLLFLINISLLSKAQKPKTDSMLKKNSVGINFPHFKDIVYRASNGWIRVPLIELCYQHAIHKKIYFNAGLTYPYYDNYSNWHFGNKSSPYNIKIKAGVDFKLKLFRRFYFSPSWDFYFTHEKYFLGNNTSQEIWNETVYSTGHDLNFEYFPCKRISIDASLFALSYGIRYPVKSLVGGSFLNHYGWVQIPKILAFGINYNF